jgi:hypothetical protein
MPMLMKTKTRKGTLMAILKRIWWRLQDRWRMCRSRTDGRRINDSLSKANGDYFEYALGLIDGTVIEFRAAIIWCADGGD